MIKTEGNSGLSGWGEGQNDCILPKTTKMDNVNVLIIEDILRNVPCQKVLLVVAIIWLVLRAFNEALQLFITNKKWIFVIIDIFLNGLIPDGITLPRRSM
jgi:hypothetical protein